MDYPVLNLARPTPGDEKFYKRWEVFGPVFGPVGVHRECAILVVDQRTIPSREFFQKQHSIRYVCSATTGHTHLANVPPHIPIISLRGETQFLGSIRSVSQFVTLLILRHARPLTYYGQSLTGKVLGLVGCGRIGKQMRDIGWSLGMEILVHDPKAVISCPLDILMRDSDVISIHAEENSETRNLINKEMISLMKTTAYFINTARGSIVNEKALAQALWEKKISGAAIDVTHDPEVDWFTVPNVTLTPHVAGSTFEDRIRTDEFIISKLQKLLGGNT